MFGSFFFSLPKTTIEETFKKMASNQSIRPTFSKDSDLSNLGNDIRSARVIGSQWVSRSQIGSIVKLYVPGSSPTKLLILGINSSHL